MDSAEGIQKIHGTPTPRIGGLAIAFGLVVSWILLPTNLRSLLGPILVAAIPAFVSGLVEDIGKRGVVSERLLATIASGAIAWLLTGVSLRHVDVWGVDSLLMFTPISVIFTAVAVGGVANAINIIDGLNGLASGTILFCLSALGAISYLSGDQEMAKLCFILGGSTAGFMLVNYPLGKIFLGDGGAYLLGFLLGWLAVMVTVRNPSVSPWAPLLACGYPILEVLFSMARRSARTRRLDHPDRLHLHSLLWSRVMKIKFAHKSAISQNAVVLPFILVYSLLPATLSVIFRGSTQYLIISFLFCAIVYALIYMRLIYFRWSLPRRRQ